MDDQLSRGLRTEPSQVRSFIPIISAISSSSAMDATTQNLDFFLQNTMDDFSNSTNDTDSSISRRKSAVTLVLLSVFFFFGILGNLLAVIILTSKGSSKSVPLTLLRCLAFTDLAALLTGAIQTAIGMTLASQINFVLYCRFKVFSNLLVGYFSQCIATCMAVERCIAMTWPFFYNRMLSSRSVYRGLELAGVYILILSSVSFASPSAAHHNMVCLNSWQFRTRFDIIHSQVKAITGLALSLVIIVSNSVTVTNLIRMQTRQRFLAPDLISNICHFGRRTSHQLKVERSFAKILIGLSIICFICWTPYTMIVMISASGVHTSTRAAYISSFLVGLNFVLDPYVYILLKQGYRRRAGRLLAALVVRRRANKPATAEDEAAAALNNSVTCHSIVHPRPTPRISRGKISSVTSADSIKTVRDSTTF